MMKGRFSAASSGTYLIIILIRQVLYPVWSVAQSRDILRFPVVFVCVKSRESWRPFATTEWGDEKTEDVEYAGSVDSSVVSVACIMLHLHGYSQDLSYDSAVLCTLKYEETTKLSLVLEEEEWQHCGQVAKSAWRRGAKKGQRRQTSSKYYPQSFPMWKTMSKTFPSLSRWCVLDSLWRRTSSKTCKKA